jgi:hypothetical protein
MYDSISLNIIRDNTSWDDNRIKAVIDPYPCPKPWIEYSGWLRNLFIIKWNGKLTIRGSWTKFRYGYNDRNAGIDDMRSVCQSLSNILGLPVDRGYVERVDISFNLALQARVKDYLLLLKYARGYKRAGFYNTGRIFNKAETVLAFYDKNAEARLKGHIIPGNHNILRYELRSMYPARLLERPGGIYLADLLETEIANTLIGCWVKEYFRVVKNRKAILPPAISSLKDLTDFVSLVGVGALGGEPGLHEMIDSFDFPLSNNASKIRNDMRKSVDRVHSSLKLVTGNRLEAELDAAVMRTAWMARS